MAQEIDSKKVLVQRFSGAQEALAESKASFVEIECAYYKAKDVYSKALTAFCVAEAALNESERVYLKTLASRV